MENNKTESTTETGKRPEEICGRQVKEGRRNQLMKLIEYLDEEDFCRLTAFHAGYEAGRQNREWILNYRIEGER